MKVFQRNPLIVEAVQWTGHNEDEVKEVAGDQFTSVTQCTENDVACVNCTNFPEVTGELVIKGTGDDDDYVQGVETGHWIVKMPGGMLAVMTDSTLRFNYKEITYAGSD